MSIDDWLKFPKERELITFLSNTMNDNGWQNYFIEETATKEGNHGFRIRSTKNNYYVILLIECELHQIVIAYGTESPLDEIKFSLEQLDKASKFLDSINRCQK